MSENLPAEQRGSSPEGFRKELAIFGDQIKSVLPPHIPLEKFSRVVMTAVVGEPKLLSMDRKALFTACLECAKDGLLPDKKEAALVPFKGVPKYMPMVRGIIKTVRNSGELSTITAHCVYEKDKYRYWVDSDGEHIEHEPQIFGERGKIIGVYALAKLKDGSVQIEPLGMADIQKIRGVSAAKNGPWDDWFDEMAKKSAIRRLAKKLPMSSDVERVIQRDDDMYDFDRPQGPDKGAEMTAAIREAMAKEQTKQLPKPPEVTYEPEKTESDVPQSFDSMDPLANYVAPVETGTGLAGKRLGELKLDLLEAKIKLMNDWHERNRVAPKGKIAEFLARADEYVRREKAKTQGQAPVAQQPTSASAPEPAPWELETPSLVGGSA